MNYNLNDYNEQNIIALPNQHEPSDKESKSGYISVKAAAILAVVVLIFSTGTGFLGGYFALRSLYNASDSESSDSPAVLFQSVSGAYDGSTSSTASSVSSYALNSVVEIITESVTYNTFMGQYVSEGAGSGVIISSDGYIATNHHVISDAGSITVTLSDGTEYPAQLVASDTQTDLAVLKIEADNLTPAVFGSSASLCVGEPVIAIGNPLGELGGTVTGGIISALDREVTIDGQTMTLLQTDASVSPGNSGGGLFNSKGELIGIVNAKSSGEYAEGLGFAIPSDTAKDIIEQLIAFGYVQGRISLGVSLVDVNDRYTASFYRVSGYGVYVIDVEENSCASAAGIKAGDRLVSIDGTEFYTSAELTSLLNEYEVGDTVTFTISRDRRNITLTVTLEEFIG